MLKSSGYAARWPQSLLEPFEFERREPGAEDVVIDILYCGICHSDLHYVEDGKRRFPVVPGHEIIGRVRSMGPAVSKFAVGDTVAIGCVIDSCRQCERCRRGRENLCEERATFTYGGLDRRTGQPNYGGYSDNYVVDQNFLLSVPKSLETPAAAPLLCAGITVYRPLRRWNVQPGQRVGIVGMGGLGHLAIKVAKALGAEVAVFTTSDDKRKDAISFGADAAVLSTSSQEMATWKDRLDYVIDTVSADHDINGYLDLLKTEGEMCLLGVPPTFFALAPKALIVGDKSLIGSNIGGIEETQEMLDFCGRHGVTAAVELLPLRDVNRAYERLRRNDVRYRFVVDMTMA